MLFDKPTNFEIHCRQKNPYHGNNLNKILISLMFYLALILILLFLLVLQVLCLNQIFYEIRNIRFII